MADDAALEAALEAEEAALEALLLAEEAADDAALLALPAPEEADDEAPLAAEEADPETDEAALASVIVLVKALPSELVPVVMRAKRVFEAETTLVKVLPPVVMISVDAPSVAIALAPLKEAVAPLTAPAAPEAPEEEAPLAAAEADDESEDATEEAPETAEVAANEEDAAALEPKNTSVQLTSITVVTLTTCRKASAVASQVACCLCEICASWTGRSTAITYAIAKVHV